MDLIELAPSTTTTLRARGFNILDKVNELFLPITLPGREAGEQLSWPEIRKLWVLYSNPTDGRASRVSFYKIELTKNYINNDFLILHPGKNRTGKTRHLG